MVVLFYVSDHYIRSFNYNRKGTKIFDKTFIYELSNSQYELLWSFTISKFNFIFISYKIPNMSYYGRSQYLNLTVLFISYKIPNMNYYDRSQYLNLSLLFISYTIPNMNYYDRSQYLYILKYKRCRHFDMCIMHEFQRNEFVCNIYNLSGSLKYDNNNLYNTRGHSFKLLSSFFVNKRLENNFC